MSRNRKSDRKVTARSNSHSASGPKGIARLDEAGLCAVLAKQSDPLILVLDGIQDPHNLGACLRSADGAGALAVVIPRHKSVSVTETVVRVACGGAASVPVVQVGNLARFLQTVREDFGMRSVGTADATSQDLFSTDLTGALAIVLGAEEKGMRRLTTESCDELIRIPMMGDVPCLNVSNAAAVCLFESVRQRS